MQHGQTMIILLAGGNKDSQKRDIEKALEIAEQIIET